MADTDNKLSSEVLDKLREMGKLLDEQNVPQNDRYAVVTEATYINIFGKEEGKKLWQELLDSCPEEPYICDPAKGERPPWER